MRKRFEHTRRSHIAGSGCIQKLNNSVNKPRTCHWDLTLQNRRVVTEQSQQALRCFFLSVNGPRQCRVEFQSKHTLTRTFYPLSSPLAVPNYLVPLCNIYIQFTQHTRFFLAPGTAISTTDQSYLPWRPYHQGGHLSGESRQRSLRSTLNRQRLPLKTVDASSNDFRHSSQRRPKPKSTHLSVSTNLSTQS